MSERELDDLTEAERADLTEREEADRVEIHQFLEGFDGNDEVRMAVYRIPEGGRGKRKFLFADPVRGHNMEEVLTNLRDQYGGGEFAVEVRDAKGAWLRRTNVEVEPPITPLPGSGVAPPAPDTPKRDSPAELVTALSDVMERANQQNRDLMLELVKAMRPAESAVAFNPVDMQKSVIEGLVAMRELGGGGGGDLDTFLKAFEMARELGVGGGGESNAWDVVKTSLTSLGPLLMQGLQQQNHPGQKPANPVPALAAPAEPVAPGPEASATDASTAAPGGDEQLSVEELQARFGQVMELCHGGAAINADPSPYAAIAVDRLGLELLQRALCQPGQLDGMLKQAPELEQYRAWFEELIQVVVDWAKENNEHVHTNQPGGDAGAVNGAQPADGSAGGGGGDPGHAQDHGAAGDGGED